MAQSNGSKGTTYNLAKPRDVNGKKVWDRMGTLFLRANGQGGVIYLNNMGTQVEIAVFIKKPRESGNPGSPAPAAAAS